MSAGPAAYARPLRLLHWTTALLVAAQAGLALTNALVYERRPVLAETVVQAHLSLGVLIFGLTLLRLAVRAAMVSPAMPGDMAPPMWLAARTVHAALYVLLLVLPLSGYVKLAALGFEIVVFGLLPLPALPVDPDLAALARSMHTGAAIALGVLLTGHIGAAVFHKLLMGAPVLQRMYPTCYRYGSSAAR